MCVHVVSVVQSLTYVWLFATPWTAAHHSLLSSTIRQVCLNSCQLSRWCYRTISLSATQFFRLPSFPASDSFPMSQFFTSGVQSIGVLASVSVLPMDIQDLFFFFFWMDWLDLAVQGALKSLLQHHNSKASILQCSAFFIVQLSHPYTTTGKAIALTIWTFVGKVMSLLFNMLSSLVIAFLLEQVSFNFMAAVTICSDFGAQKCKVCHCFHCFPIYLPWSDRTGCHDLTFLNVEF